MFLIPYATAEGLAAEVQPDKVQESSRARSPLANLVARYARSKDYHGVIKRRLTKVFDELSAGEFRYRVVVDSVPFLDRAHAQIARLGFVGRNTMLIRPGLGSYFFIASVLTDAPVERFGRAAAAPAAARRLEDWGCATCDLCVRACPTGALLGDYTMDARRCLSYWSIEHRGPAPDTFVGAFRESFFGCDVCQEVCPYNLRPRVRASAGPWGEFAETSAALGQLTLRDVATMSPRDYETWFGGLPLTRAKYPGLVRNALYALLALGDLESLRGALDHWEQRLVHSGEPAEDASEAALREVVDQVRRLSGA